MPVFWTFEKKSKMALFDFLVNGCLLVGIGVIGMIANVLCIIVVSRPSMRATSINLIVMGNFLNSLIFNEWYFISKMF